MKMKKIVGLIVIVAVMASLATVAFAAEIPALEDWKAEKVTAISERLDEAVEAGRLTEEEAGEIYDDRVERIASCDGVCDGTGDNGVQKRAGDGEGLGIGGGLGQRMGGGQGIGGGLGHRGGR